MKIILSIFAILLCLNTYGQVKGLPGHREMFKGQKIPYDTAVVMTLREYIREGERVFRLQYRVDSLTALLPKKKKLKPKK